MGSCRLLAPVMVSARATGTFAQTRLTVVPPGRWMCCPGYFTTDLFDAFEL